ncbi:hypothetical protein BD626DRAFT_130426 [Schizophyllum amplum]|uniref:Uncharacterized protein n=1 Tax=Schizophyllum amplum TaxID=97359 RepID=A0A550C668_9AGAR|nr:hypothetical protein BD626DRAFT_130426 [Auriculariopsis ampla]
MSFKMPTGFMSRRYPPYSSMGGGLRYWSGTSWWGTASNPTSGLAGGGREVSCVGNATWSGFGLLNDAESLRRRPYSFGVGGAFISRNEERTRLRRPAPERSALSLHFVRPGGGTRSRRAPRLYVAQDALDLFPRPMPRPQTRVRASCITNEPFWPVQRDPKHA